MPQLTKLLLTVLVAIAAASTCVALQDQNKPPVNANKAHLAASPTATPATTPAERTTDTSNTVPANPSPSVTSPTREDFSQLTVLLLASAVALFIALLAWSDQIKGIDKDIRDLETKFQDRTGIERQVFVRIVEPISADDRGAALLEVMTNNRIQVKVQADVLKICTRWHKQWKSITALSAWKYYLTIGLTFTLFVCGAISVFMSTMLLLAFPAVLVASLFVILICIAERERSLRSLLKSVSDKV